MCRVAARRAHGVHAAPRRRPSTGRWPTTAAGACSQRPTHGAATTRTSRPSIPGSRAQHPARLPSRRPGPSQTRTVSARAVLPFADDVEVVIEVATSNTSSCASPSPCASAARWAVDRWPKRSCRRWVLDQQVAPAWLTAEQRGRRHALARRRAGRLGARAGAGAACCRNDRLVHALRCRRRNRRRRRTRMARALPPCCPRRANGRRSRRPRRRKPATKWIAAIQSFSSQTTFASRSSPAISAAP